MASSSRSGRACVALGVLLFLGACAGSGGPGGQAPSLAIADPEASLAAAREAIAADPSDADAWFLLARTWEAKDRNDSALVAYEQLVAIAPENVEGVVHRGLALEKAGRNEEALAAYDDATRLAPTDPIPWVNLGSLHYFTFKRTYEAKKALTEAIRLDPMNADAHFNLGVLFADANLYGEAKLEWEAVLEHAGDSPARTLAEEALARIEPLLGSESGESEGEEGS